MSVQKNPKANTTNMKKDITNKKETIKFAKDFIKNIKVGKPILLYGTLGTGKTFFASEIIKTLTNTTAPIQSPTFSILQTYPSPYGEIYHYDLYRIKDSDELFELDIDNALTNKITIIEWPEIIEDYIKTNYEYIALHFSLNNNSRFIETK